ncbi:MAG: FecR domain-containing protein [Marinifilaceae bacterium]|nr:FecR domain-containing protein [Marinifilaceae bacterium]
MDRRNLRITELLAKFFMGTREAGEEEELRDWIGGDGQREAFVKRMLNKENFEENEKMLARFSGKEGWQEVRGRVVGHKIGWSRKLIRYAAVLVLVFMAGAAYWWLASGEDEVRQPVRRQIMAGGTGARLTTGNGEVFDIVRNQQFSLREEDGTAIRTDSTGTSYQRPDTLTGEASWNTMETLTGMEYTLTLADGTRVYMNAETRLTFPASFQGQERRVRLTGEAYFDVAKDAAHPFIIEMAGVDVKVLGTSFNLRAYDNEASIVTTLVEGKVAVTDSVETREIVPGEQLVYRKESGRMDVAKVDVSLYTAWRLGKFVFKNEPLADVMAYLAKWYGFEYRFIDERAAAVRVGASMDRYEDMTPIVEMLRRTGLVNVTQVDNMLYISSAK